MDPYFFFGLEEYDYCKQAREAGYKVVYIPSSKVWHKAGASSAKLPQYVETWNLIKGKGGFGNYKYYYRLYRRHCPPVLFILPFLGTVVLRVPLWVPAIRFIRHRDWQAIKKGIKKRLPHNRKTATKW